MWLLSTLMLMGSAQASQVLVWSYDSFPHELPSYDQDGWERGYEEDYWIGYELDDWGAVVFSTTDDNSDEDFGEGGAKDNWLVNSEVDLSDTWVQTYAYTEDDDTLGVVFNFQDALNYYGFWMVGTHNAAGGAPNASNPFNDETWDVRSVLVKVENGTATILDESSISYARNTRMKIAAGINDGKLWGKLWVESDQSWSDYDLALSYTDTDPFGSGMTGLYAYDIGGLEDESLTLFSDILVYAYDDDDDGVIDDEDNCEDTANPEQEDWDGDGIGSACDEDEGGGDGADGGEGGEGSGDGGEGSDDGGEGSGDGGEGSGDGGRGDDGGTDTDGGIDTGYDSPGEDGAGDGSVDGRPLAPGGQFSSCGCAGGGGAVGGLVFAVLGLSLRRRRAG